MSRIAYVLGSFPVVTETFIGNEIRAMEAKGHTIFPIALHRPQSGFQSEDAAIANRTLYFSSIDPETSRKLIWQYIFRLHRLIPFAWAQTTEPYYPLLVHAAHLANYIREKDCTHIHAHFGWGAAIYAIAAAKLLKLPVTFTCHGSDVYARPVDLALKCRAATAVFGVAPTITTDLQKIAGSTPCHMVYCGVDTERFRPLAEGVQKHGRWLFAGRLIDCKGIDDILAAWAHLPPVQRPHLDIVGDGTRREELELYVSANSLADYVRFLGTKSASWLAEQGPYYRAFIAAFKQGSDGSSDTAPMVLKEAMAMGLPIVTTDFRDIPGVVSEECAVICPVATPDTIAEAVLSVQGMSQEMLRAMGISGRARAETFYSLRQQANRITELFDLYKK